jgi:cell division protein FtsB
LKSEILLLEKTHFEKTMQENQRTVDKLDKSTDFLKAELSKIKSGLQLDLNLEKSRVTSQLQTFEGSLEVRRQKDHTAVFLVNH